MTLEEIRRLAGIEYVGIGGSSNDCQDSVLRMLQYGDRISRVRILTCDHDHCLILTVNLGDLVAVKSGFGSGYGGTGPNTFSYSLQLLEAHGAEIEEYEVSIDLLERLDASYLTTSDLEYLDQAKPVRPIRWHDYVLEHHWALKSDGTLWREFPSVIPYAAIDKRIVDLALAFWDNPDARLLDGYRRLEDIFRKKTGIREHGQKLFSQALVGPTASLCWDGIDDGERAGRTQLFTGAFLAHRNPRAHREQEGDSDAQLSEFMLLNHLFRLESTLRLEDSHG